MKLEKRLFHARATLATARAFDFISACKADVFYFDSTAHACRFVTKAKRSHCAQLSPPHEKHDSHENRDVGSQAD
jgi:hypothetical protein